MGKGVYTLNQEVLSAYITGSGNYVTFFLPILIAEDVTSISVSFEGFGCYLYNGYVSSFDNNYLAINRIKNGLRISKKFNTTQSANTVASVDFTSITLTLS